MERDKLYKGIIDIKKIRLSSAEKQRVFGALNSYAVSTSPKVPIKTYSELHWYSFAVRSKFSYVAVFFLAIFTGGGLVIASNSSLPGELLYPLKVNVSEPLQEVTTLSATSKVNLEAQKVQTRLEEVEVLAAQGKLDTALRVEVQARLDKQTKSFQDAVQNVEDKNTETQSLSDQVQDVQLDLQSKINVHNRILQKIENHSGSKQKDEIAKFRSSIAENVNNVAKKKTKNNKISTSTFEENESTLKSLINNTENSLKKSGEATSTLQADIMSDTQNDLNQAKQALEEARQKRFSGDDSGAGEDLQDSRSKIESANVFLRQGIRLGQVENLPDENN